MMMVTVHWCATEGDDESFTPYSFTEYDDHHISRTRTIVANLNSLGGTLTSSPKLNDPMTSQIIIDSLDMDTSMGTGRVIPSSSSACYGSTIEDVEK